MATVTEARALARRITRETLGVYYCRRRGRAKGWRAVAAGFNEYAGTGATQTEALANLLFTLGRAVRGGS